jgi:hypothetical protein
MGSWPASAGKRSPRTSTAKRSMPKRMRSARPTCCSKARVIADVVTGKLDVREAAARLPDEAEEPELADEGDAISAVDEEPIDDVETIIPEEVEA